MIKIDNIRNINSNQGFEHLIIVRSLKKKILGTTHMPNLSPSPELFHQYLNWKKNGQWNETKFIFEYAPRFIYELKHNTNAMLLLSSIAYRSHNENIALYCFCEDESLCHRSIVAGILLGMGADIDCNKDYLMYYDWFKLEDGQPYPVLSERINR